MNSVQCKTKCPFCGKVLNATIEYEENDIVFVIENCTCKSATNEEENEYGIIN